jgi:hypothetical protein
MSSKAPVRFPRLGIPRVAKRLHRGVRSLPFGIQVLQAL